MFFNCLSCAFPRYTFKCELSSHVASLFYCFLSLFLSSFQVPHGVLSTRPPWLWSAWWAVWSAWSARLTSLVASTSESYSTFRSISLQTVISSLPLLPVRPLSSGGPRPPVYPHDFYCIKANVMPTLALSLVKSQTDVCWKLQRTIRHECIVSSCVSNRVLGYSPCICTVHCVLGHLVNSFLKSLKWNITVYFLILTYKFFRQTFGFIWGRCYMLANLRWQVIMRTPLFYFFTIQKIIHTWADSLAFDSHLSTIFSLFKQGSCSDADFRLKVVRTTTSYYKKMHCIYLKEI